MRRALFAVILVLCGMPAAAQESGQVGLAAGYPGGIGIIWHVSDTVAVRPEFTFGTSSSESGVSSIETSSWAIGAGVSALFYTGKVRENVRTYVTPRFSYARTSADTEGTNVFSSGTHTNTYHYSGSFGMQYSPGRRFSVYGEVGLGYQHGEAVYEANPPLPIVVSAGTSTNKQFGSRAGVGVIFYFK